MKKREEKEIFVFTSCFFRVIINFRIGGAIFAGYAWVTHIGESLCESTELMIDYINGDEKAGEKLELKAAVHIIADVTIARFGMKASQEFAKIHLDQRIGSFFAKAFERTSIGCDGALEILNRVSPKYTQLLTDLINKYDSSVAIAISYIYETESVSGVENALNNIENNSLYREIINETDTVNLNGKTVHIAKQSVHGVENAMNSILENYNTGDLAKGAKSEANTAKFIMDNNLDTIEQFRLKIFENINGKQGNQLGDIDVGTSRFLIEVKTSVSDIRNSSQFIKYTDPFSSNYFNFDNKKVILYIVEGEINYSNPKIMEIQDMGVTIVNSLDELMEAMK